MEIVHEQRDLERYMREAVKVSNDSPVLLDRFLNDAIECDVDCLRDGHRRDLHRRRDGAHRAGRRAQRRLGLLAAAVLPVAATVAELKRQTAAMAGALNVVGPDERAVRHPGASMART
jgi:carbamoyl-phosphate synthase large subunit